MKFNRKRYWFVAYTANTADGKSISGSCSVISNCGKHLNLEYFYDYMLKDQNREKKYDIKEVVITNFIELSESDYHQLFEKYNNETT